jgi:hypothetical protein
MRARREIGEATLRLFQGDREIGYIRGRTVGFFGFVNADEAGYAGWVAHVALATRRGPERPWQPGLMAEHLIVREGERQHVVARAGILATLRPPASDPSGEQDWGVELALWPEEEAEVIAVARARTMWTGLLGSGAVGRMRQFGAAAPLPV